MGDLALLVALGVAAGMLAGLFGVGGGIVFVPALTLVAGLGQLEAEATSLLAIVPVAVLGTWRQRTSPDARWRDALVLGIASIATAVAGAVAADALPEHVLRGA
ncbi:MAG TPA: sulfite exporter TauE/SafE family protein, partial [Miltoncostaeaceae bacterium]|nr:sulfite exporter TauE/SafE family protein [Miltoncostaeaceae bacterium]